MVNIFRLHDEPEQAAKHHADQHVMSGIHETALILASALRERADWNDEAFFTETDADSDEHMFYGSSHTGHPLVDWVTYNQNWQWALDYLEALYDEKVYRWGGGHKTWEDYARFLPREVQAWEPGRTLQYQAIDPDIDEDDPVIGYRRYYIESKGGVDGWMDWNKDRDPPDWLVNEDPYNGLEGRSGPQTVVGDD